MKKKKSHRIALIISGIIGLASFSFLLIEYLKLRHFEKALSDLVESKSNGQYRLVIGKSEVDLQDLYFVLENLTIEKTDKNTTGRGVHAVHIPSLKANFGSLRSFLNFGQVTIEEITIAEPYIEIDTKDENKETQFNIASTLIKIFPSIESILERFNVQLFRINRGMLKIDKDKNELLNLKFIDFLVSEWNMKQLTDSSRIQLDIGAQKVNLNKASFTFSEVEFKYPEHYLIFKDFSLQSLDTLTNSKINVTGKSVLINRLDYNELYNNQRFKLHKIEILEPKFTGRLGTKKSVEKGKEHYKHPLGDILKQTFGEIELDSAIIKDAHLNLTLAINNDSVKSNFPHVDIVLSSFKLKADTSRIEIREINLDLKKTEINLNDNVKLLCSNIHMGLHRSFTISNAELINVKTKKTFIRCDKINMHNFRMLYFIFDKQILANTIVLKNADVTISPEYLNLFPAASPNTDNKKKFGVDIKYILLDNVNLDYSDHETRVSFKGVNSSIRDIHELSSLKPHQIATLQLKSVRGYLKKNDLNIRTGKVDLNERFAVINDLDLKLQNFKLTLDRFRAVPILQTDSTGTNFSHWENVEIGTLIADGEIPQEKKSEGHKLKKISSASLKNFSILSFTGDVTSNENRISFKAKNLKGSGVSYKDEKIYFENFSGKFYQLKSIGANNSVGIDSLMTNTNQKTIFHNLNYESKDLSASIPYLEIDKIDGKADTKLISRFFARNIHAHKTTGDSLAIVDSLFLHGIKLTKGHEPVINEIEVFNPQVNLSNYKPIDQSEKQTPEDPVNFYGVRKFKIHGSKLKLAQSSISIPGSLSGHFEKNRNELLCERVELISDKATIDVSDISMIKGDITVGKIKIDPKMSYFDNVLEQTDIIGGEMNNVKLTNFMLDTLLNAKKVLADSIKVGDFSLHIKRDKRLPDPLPIEKPLTLDKLLHKGKIYSKAIEVKNGDLTYQEVSLKTGNTGQIDLNGITATISQAKGKKEANYYILKANAKFYDQATFQVEYQTIDSSSFNLSVIVDPFDLTVLNRMILPLQAMEIKSGHLKQYTLNVNADHEYAKGMASMSYENLHLEIFKRSEPEKKNIGSELLTLLADGIVLKHNKDGAIAQVQQPRKAEKSIFNYWIKSVIHGSMSVIRHGKKKKIKPV